ncbi:hypothetical protein [Paenibacillus terreus]|uniref:hypothetical protein n=1 Tax=Paenibacillus terreus TaxID=1387834 RepID=UPI0035CD26A3
MVGRIQNGVETRYYYDGDQIIAEAVIENGTPKLKASYVRGSKLEAIVRDKRESTHFLSQPIKA